MHYVWSMFQYSLQLTIYQYSYYKLYTYIIPILILSVQNLQCKREQCRFILNVTGAYIINTDTQLLCINLNESLMKAVNNFRLMATQYSILVTFKTYTFIYRHI